MPKQCCRKVKSIRHDSWFSQSHLTLEQILEVTFLWTEDMSGETVCAVYMDQIETEKIGGVGKVVEINESNHRSPASTNQGVKRSVAVALLKPKRQPITNEMLGQMLSQLDRDHKPSHDRLAAIMLGFFGLLRDNATPLYLASQNGHHDVVQTLLGQVLMST
eukprot:Em0591g3a